MYKKETFHIYNKETGHQIAEIYTSEINVTRFAGSYAKLMRLDLQIRRADGSKPCEQDTILHKNILLVPAI